jgi:hypothetical protein
METGPFFTSYISKHKESINILLTGGLSDTVLNAVCELYNSELIEKSQLRQTIAPVWKEYFSFLMEIADYSKIYLTEAKQLVGVWSYHFMGNETREEYIAKIATHEEKLLTIGFQQYSHLGKLDLNEGNTGQNTAYEQLTESWKLFMKEFISGIISDYTKTGYHFDIPLAIGFYDKWLKKGITKFDTIYEEGEYLIKILREFKISKSEMLKEIKTPIELNYSELKNDLENIINTDIKDPKKRYEATKKLETFSLMSMFLEKTVPKEVGEFGYQVLEQSKKEHQEKTI